MERSLVEVNYFSANEDISGNLSHLNVHYHVHKSSPISPGLNQMNLVNIGKPYILSSVLKLSSRVCL